jgi:hypothetical protein
MLPPARDPRRPRIGSWVVPPKVRQPLFRGVALSGSQLREKLFHPEDLNAEALAKLPFGASLIPRPAYRLTQQRRTIGLRR